MTERSAICEGLMRRDPKGTMPGPLDERALADIAGPLGAMRLAVSPEGIAGLWFMDQSDLPPGRGRLAAPEELDLLTRAQRQLDEWFAGRRQVFDLPLAPRGTPFQRAVWEGLLTLPFGVTVSYGELAHRIRRTQAVRALAQAVGRNPISIVIPCHRVIGHDTALTGFGGGLARKRQLLLHEGHCYTGQTAKARRLGGGGQMELLW